MNSDVLNWKCLIRVTVSQTRFDTTKSQAPLRWFVDGFGAVCLSNLFVWVFWQISLHLEVLTRFDTTKSQAPLRWFVDGFGAVCLSNLFVWVFWQISLHLEVLRQIARRQKLQFFAISRPQIQRFKDSKVEKKFFESKPPQNSKIQRFKDSKVEKKFFESKPQNPNSKIQRFKDSKVEKKFFESKPPKFKDSKIQRLKRSSLNLSLGVWGFDSKNFFWTFESLNLWIFFGGFDSKNFFSTFKSLNLWILGLRLRFKELVFNLWIFESLNLWILGASIQRTSFQPLNLWIFESLNLGSGAWIQRTSFQPLNLWIFEFWGLRFKELLFNLWIFESLNLWIWGLEIAKIAIFLCVQFA